MTLKVRSYRLDCSIGGKRRLMVSDLELAMVSIGAPEILVSSLRTLDEVCSPCPGMRTVAGGGFSPNNSTSSLATASTSSPFSTSKSRWIGSSV